jgi:hypothetical protein
MYDVIYNVGATLVVAQEAEGRAINSVGQRPAWRGAGCDASRRDATCITAGHRPAVDEVIDLRWTREQHQNRQIITNH